jgi:alpha-ribazole phosphatase
VDWRLGEGVTRLILVRHGEPEDDARGRCYGRLDVGLSSLGVTQAERCAAWLRKAPIVAVYASPRRRAVVGAELIAQTHGLKMFVRNELCEIDFGLFEGLTYDEIQVRYPQLYSEWMARPTEVEFPDGESFAVMRERVLRCAASLLSLHREKTIALVSHGGVNRVLLAEALGMDQRELFRVAQSYAAVSVVDYFNQRPLVRLVNYCAGEESSSV